MLAMTLPQAPLSNSSLLPPWPKRVGEVPKILPCAAGAALPEPRRGGRPAGWSVPIPPARSVAGVYHKENLSNTVYYCSFINLHEAARLTRAVKAVTVSGA